MRAPVIIGAMGGSGTRVVARIVNAAGVFLGTNRNVSEDAMEFVDFYDRWINACLERDRRGAGDDAAMVEEFRTCVARHRLHVPSPDAAWGWKEPRSIYLLPFFHRRFPALKFIHVVRDGRDMAFSANQNQLRKHGAAVIGREHDALPQPVRTAVLWRAINVSAAEYGEALLADRYLRVRFEDLCHDPLTAVRRIGAFLGCDIASRRVLAEITPPLSIGRWRDSAHETLAEAVAASAQPALARFGYDA